MRFIELTEDENGRKQLVNVDHIVSVERWGDECAMELTNGQRFCPKESYEEIKSMLTKI